MGLPRRLPHVNRDDDKQQTGSDYDDALNALAFHARPYDDESKKEPTRTRSV